MRQSPAATAAAPVAAPPRLPLQLARPPPALLRSAALCLPVVCSSRSGYLGKKRYSSNRLCTMQANTSCSRPSVEFLNPLSTCGQGDVVASSRHGQAVLEARVHSSCTKRTLPCPALLSCLRCGWCAACLLAGLRAHLHQRLHPNLPGIDALEVGVGLLLCRAGQAGRECRGELGLQTAAVGKAGCKGYKAAKATIGM